VHELSMMQEVMEILGEQIRIHRVKKVHQVNLKVGRMMAVVPSSLSFCFEILSKHTPLEGARLAIEEIPVTCRCRECKEEFTVASFVFVCPKCRGTQLEQISGNEFSIQSMEVDELGD
jgi:hydrogenase nickel incorporation protein HypA/HybF